MIMKRIYAGILLPAVSALLCCCEQAEPSGGFDVETEGHTVFTADMQALLLGQDEQFVWEKGDYIGVFGSKRGNNEKYILKKAGYETASAEFYGPNVSGETIGAYYPYSGGFKFDGGVFSVNLAARQQFVSENDAVRQFLEYSPHAFAFYEGDSRMVFSYPMGMLLVRLDLEEVLTVKSLTLSVPGGALAGGGTVSRGSGLKMGASAVSSVVLDCAEGVASKEGDLVRDFMIVLPPAMYADAALTLEIEGEKPYRYNISGLEIKKVTGKEFPVTAVTVAAGSVEGFEVETGYFEEE